MVIRVRAVGGVRLRNEIVDEIRPQVECIEASLAELGVDAVAMYALGDLEAGRAALVRRFDLPDWCADRHLGEPGDYLLLTVDNELIEPPEPVQHNSIRSRTAKRRAR